LNKDKNH